MNINRHNYETFFLLYADNELSAAERKAVEIFVAEHTDLEKELAQLQDMILPADEIIFNDKINLFRSLGEPESTEEKLLLYLDNELGKGDVGPLENLIAGDATVKADWKILLQTKLDPAEKIVFADKHLLYRKERDNVVVGRFAKWAIAAAVIGAGFFIGINLRNNTLIEENVAANTTTKGTIKQAATPGVKTNTVSPADTVLKENNNSNLAIQQPAKDKKQNVAQQPAVDQAKKQLIATNNPDQRRKRELPVELKSIDDKSSSLLAGNTLKIEKLSPERNDRELTVITTKKHPEITDVNVMTKEENGFASTASLTNESSDNRILYMKEEDVSNSKAGSFFRKLKRTVERKTNIKTGNSLKIAGFEIALK